MNNRYFYYVEGKCEKKLIETLKEQQLILPGKTEVFNATQDLFNNARFRLIPPHSTIILVFDTDRKDTHALVQNICALKKQKNVKHIYCIPQVECLEDELLRCTDAKSLKELINCKSISGFKQAFLSEKNLYPKLINHCFDLSKLWNAQPSQEYLNESIMNDGAKIKLL